VRFTVVTYGSEGDTRPLVALSRGLIDGGHEVQFFAEQSTVGNATAHGVPVEALAGDIKSTLPMDSPSERLRRRDVMKAVKDALRVINGNTASWMKVVSDHARASDAILFAGLASPMAEAIAEELNKPAINLYLQPTSPTREFASPILPPMQLPGWANLLSYRASPKSMIRRLYGKSADAARAGIFGKPNSAGNKRDFPILYGFSRHLVPRPGDWPATHHICGHWSLLSNDWQAPSDLLEFLSAGPPPIYVGFGAVSSFIRQKGLSEIASAIAGRRALFFPGWSKITAAMLPKNFFVLDDTPHAWLFPLTSMVIHHCGAGTTHTAARAGVPSIALPVGADQFFWAGRLVSAGVAPKYIRGTKIEAKSLAKMIDFAARDDVRERAKALGVAMSEENGVANAVTAIETQTSRPPDFW
jgi:sterol 3beta-glucosyltransferase